MFHICLDLEMSELTPTEMRVVPLRNEVIQIGSVILDDNFKFVDEFQIFVKPQYSHVDSFITNLTGIRDENLYDATDFVTSFEKYTGWIESKIGEADFVTYCWSNKDYSQLKNELFLKAKDREDLMENLKTFVDLQRTFSEVLGTKISVKLETAVKFCHETFDGQAHTAIADAFNTAVILHKLCLGNFNPQFYFHHDAEVRKIEEEKEQEEKLQESYKSDMSAFFSPELLKKFGINNQNKENKIPTHDDYSNYLPPKMSKREKKLLKMQQKEQKKLNRLPQEIQSQIANHHPTLKYHIEPADWMKFYVKMLYMKAEIK